MLSLLSVFASVVPAGVTWENRLMQQPTFHLTSLGAYRAETMRNPLFAGTKRAEWVSVLIYGLAGFLLAYYADVVFNWHEKFQIWNRDMQIYETDALPAALIIGLLSFLGRFFLLRSIALRKHAKQLEFSQLARTDMLTGISSRFHAEEVLFTLDPSELRLCVILDVRKFNEVNSCFGYSEGDKVLQEVANRLSTLFARAKVVARLDSESFVVITHRLDHGQQAEMVVKNILNILEKPYLGEMDLVLGFSGGATVLGDASLSPREIMKRLDIALNESRQGSESDCLFYKDTMAETLRRRRLVELRLRKAVANEEVNPYFQPIVDLATEELKGFEILARWTDIAIGVVAPDEFIATAEQSGLLGKLGEQLLRKSCRFAAAWPQHIQLSYNVAAGQLLLPDMATRLLAILSETGMAAHRLQIEITESSELVRSDIAAKNLSRLRSAGIGVAMDDFGTGYCSFERLSGNQLTCLKIDKSFVFQMFEKEDMATIVLTAIQLAKQLGLHVVAEGVETREQQAALLRMGCDYGQGYLFAKPMPMQDANVMVLAAVAKKLKSHAAFETSDTYFHERIPAFSAARASDGQLTVHKML